MLFNSLIFMFAFLPVTLAGFAGLFHKFGARAALLWLTAASLFFYGWWNPAYLLLLGSSTIFNFWVGKKISASGPETPSAKRWLIPGIVINLAVLAFFKYADFFIGTVNSVAATEFPLLQIVLPLAISFVTFQKIAYLVDCYRGLAREDNFLNFAMFVTFFPQLIAGPIVHYREMMPQFKALTLPALKAAHMASGLTLFAMGLFKKCVLADTIAIHANSVYGAAESGQALALSDAWAGAFAYSFQIYFDFSGYSDMAIGLALMFGIYLPINFLSPYRATGFIEFWRRWHITLSRFLREYLYIPLGGNRCGKLRQAFNVTLTMLLGGLWHGASWTFVLWGGLHGLFIAANHGLRTALGSRALPTLLCIPVTFVLVTVLWVLFRAETLDGAQTLLHAMAGQNVDTPASLVTGWKNMLLFAIVAGIVFLLPNSMRYMNLQQRDTQVKDIPAGSLLERGVLASYAPNLFNLLLSAGFLFCAWLFMQSNLGKTFIYFDF